MSTQQNHPFSRVLRVSDIPSSGRDIEATADAEEREVIAELIGAQQVERFGYQLRVAPAGREAFSVTGAVSAKIVQTCVITLEPLPFDIEQEIDVRFMVNRRSAQREDEPIDPHAPEIEELVDDAMDLGQLACEHLVIAIDPYPKQAGQHFKWEGDDDVSEAAAEGPFAELKRFKRR